MKPPTRTPISPSCPYTAPATPPLSPHSTAPKASRGRGVEGGEEANGRRPKGRTRLPPLSPLATPPPPFSAELRGGGQTVASAPTAFRPPPCDPHPPSSLPSVHRQDGNDGAPLSVVTGPAGDDVREEVGGVQRHRLHRCPPLLSPPSPPLPPPPLPPPVSSALRHPPLPSLNPPPASSHPPRLSPRRLIPSYLPFLAPGRLLP